MLLQGKRHFYGSEQYDSNMNIIVPVEERNLFVNIRQVDIEMTKANDDFNQELKYLNQTLSTYSGLNDETHLRFEVVIITRFFLFFIFTLIR